jgi:hypothetical protein
MYVDHQAERIGHRHGAELGAFLDVDQHANGVGGRLSHAYPLHRASRQRFGGVQTAEQPRALQIDLHAFRNPQARTRFGTCDFVADDLGELDDDERRRRPGNRPDTAQGSRERWRRKEKQKRRRGEARRS